MSHVSVDPQSTTIDQVVHYLDQWLATEYPGEGPPEFGGTYSELLSEFVLDQQNDDRYFAVSNVNSFYKGWHQFETGFIPRRQVPFCEDFGCVRNPDISQEDAVFLGEMAALDWHSGSMREKLRRDLLALDWSAGGSLSAFQGGIDALDQRWNELRNGWDYLQQQLVNLCQDATFWPGKDKVTEQHHLLNNLIYKLANYPERCSIYRCFEPYEFPILLLNEA